MKRLLSVLSMLAAPALAEPVTIRSGDHPTFVRLVLSIPDGSGWQVGRIPAGYGVIIGQADDGIDPVGVFDRIPRNRIAGLDTEGGRLEIELACDCHADAFLWRPDRLVVDVVDGPPPEGNPFDAALVFEEEASGRDIGADRRIAGLPIVPDWRVTPEPALDQLPGTFTVPRRAAAFEDAERAILSSLSRAATEGFFDIPIDPVQRSFEPDDPMPPSGAARMPGLTPVTDPMEGVETRLPGAAGQNGPGLVLRSALTESAAPTASRRADPACLPERTFDVRGWGGESGFRTRIADGRAALTREFDRYPEGAIEALARSYIHFGFGAEARQVLRLDGARSAERQLLEELSRIVDGASVPDGKLAGQLHCEGPAVLWSVLAANDANRVGTEGRKRAVRELLALPLSLQRHLGVRLAAILSRAGAPELARTALDHARGDEAARTIDAALVETQIDADARAPEARREALMTLANDNPRMTPAALAQLIGLMLEQDQTPPADIVKLAETHLFESRPEGGNAVLAAAVVRSRIARAEFDRADDILSGAGLSDGSLRDALISELLMARTEAVADNRFLMLAFGELPPDASGMAVNRVASRLISLGFLDRALDVMSGTTSGAALGERRYLRAQARAMLGQTAEVERSLAGLSDDRARRIRADAYARAGAFDEALPEAMSLDDDETVTDYAWRAGQWPLLEAVDDPLLQSASRSVQRPTTLPPDQPDLAARRTLLQEAARTREMADSLLSRFSVEGAVTPTP